MSKEGHYVDNKVFCVEMVKWRKECTKAKKAGVRPPPVTDYIGRCFLAIAERLSYRPNFINYPYRDEMVGDGIENCLMYAGNPFSYFTQIIYYAFVRRIQKEKKQNYIKFKSIEAAQLNGKTPQWLKNACYDNTKIDDFFKSLSLSDLDLSNFETPVKKEAKKAVPEVVAPKSKKKVVKKVKKAKK
jgi:hypothetical protein